MISAKKFWNKRSQLYDTSVRGIYDEAYRLTAEISLQYLHPDDHVLEFACGTGICTAAIAPHVKDITAIDISDGMVSLCRQKMTRQGISNVTIKQLDIFDPALQEASFDAVMAFNVLLYVENLPAVLARIHALLKPGGIFLSATDCLGGRPTKVSITKWWNHLRGRYPFVRFDTRKSLITAIKKAGFDILESQDLHPSPPNLYIAASSV